MFRFFKDFMIYGFASILGKIAAILLMPIYTNILTKEEYGAMALITSVKGLVDLVSNLNIHSGIARDYYEEGIDRKKLISTGFFSILSLSLFIMVIGLMTRRFLGGTVLGLKDCYLSAFAIMIMTVPASSLQSYFSILTRFKKKPIHFSIGTLFQLLIQIGVSVIGVVVIKAGIKSIFLGLLIGDIFAIVYFSLLNKEYLGVDFDKKLLQRTLVFAIPTIPAILAGWLDSSIGQVLIGKYVSLDDLGVYSIALSLASVFTLISVALNNVWTPFFFENYKKDSFKPFFLRLFTIIGWMIILISFVLSLLSPEIVLLLSNEGYLKASEYFTLLCVPMGIYLLFPFASSGVSITRETKYIGLSYVLGSFCNVFLLFAFIRFIGIIAVPICLAVSRIMSYSILYKLSEKRLGYGLPNYLLIILIIISILSYIVLSIESSLIVRIIMVILGLFTIVCYLWKKYNLLSVLKIFIGNNNQ